MKISLQFVFIALIVFLLMAGVIITSLVSIVFYQLSMDRFIEEKTASLEMVANTISNPAWIHQEITLFSGSTLFFIREVAKAPDVMFVRILGENGNKVIVSSKLDERDTVIEDLPVFLSKTQVSNGIYNGLEIKQLTLKTATGQRLWMGISTENVKNQIVLVTLFLGLGIFVLFSLIIVALSISSKKLLITPLSILRGAFKKVEEEKYDVHLKHALIQEIDQVFSTFNVMTEKLGYIRKREKALLENKSQFITLMSHQIRTPLSTFKWLFSALMTEDLGKLTKAQKDIIQKGISTNNRFVYLINDLLHVSRIEKGKFGYNFKKVQFSNILNDIVEEHSLAAKQKDITYNYIPPKESLPQMKLDAEMMKMAISNLIVNAITYTSKGGTISIYLEKKNEKVLVSIKDTGIGISEEQGMNIFSPFFRTSKAISMDSMGAGLGLFIAKNIVQNHKGKIWFKSKKEKGTTFFIELPIISVQ